LPPNRCQHGRAVKCRVPYGSSEFRHRLVFARRRRTADRRIGESDNHRIAAATTATTGNRSIATRSSDTEQVAQECHDSSAEMTFPSSSETTAQKMHAVFTLPKLVLANASARTAFLADRLHREWGKDKARAVLRPQCCRIDGEFQSHVMPHRAAQDCTPARVARGDTIRSLIVTKQRFPCPVFC
jgi:hypothetical protein